MDYSDVILFAMQNPVCAVATMDGDQPRVRMFLSVFFGDNRIYFSTGAAKNVFKQICENPKVELCYYSDGRMMRITGEFEVVDDREKKRKLIEEKDYLKGLSEDDPVFKLLRLKSGKARFWSLENNLRENDIDSIDF